MGEYWDKKVKEVVEISKEHGYKELDYEFWMNKPAVITSLVIDIYKSKKEVITKAEKRLEDILKEKVLS